MEISQTTIGYKDLNTRPWVDNSVYMHRPDCPQGLPVTRVLTQCGHVFYVMEHHGDETIRREFKETHCPGCRRKRPGQLEWKSKAELRDPLRNHDSPIVLHLRHRDPPSPENSQLVKELAK